MSAEPRDRIAELCALVRAAGGTVRLYGCEVTAEDLHRVGTEIVNDKLRQLEKKVREQLALAALPALEAPGVGVPVVPVAPLSAASPASSAAPASAAAPGTASAAGCPACTTTEGCDEHRLFTCSRCKAAVAWSDACDDEHPDKCSACWNLLNLRKRVRVASRYKGVRLGIRIPRI
jgi:hypothetical protein